MKAGKVQSLLGITKPTLLKKVETYSLQPDKTVSGENIFRWQHIIKLNQILKFGNSALGTKVFSICQNKGGVGKTTSVINLATALSYIGKTLIIDLDSQANLSQSFDIYLTNNDKSVVDILENPDNKDIFNDVKIKISNNLDLLPNNLRFERWKETKRADSLSPFTLKKAIKNIKDEYNFILIDTPPALDIALEIALYASNYCLIPIEPHPFSLDGIANILEKIKYISSNDQIADFNLKILGCFINIYERNTLSDQIVSTITDKYDAFPTRIRKSVSLTQAQAFKQSVFEYDENSNASYDYYNLTFEILDKIMKET